MNRSENTKKPRYLCAYEEERYVVRDDQKRSAGTHISLTEAHLQSMELPGSEVTVERVLVLDCENGKPAMFVPMRDIETHPVPTPEEVEKEKVRRILKEMSQDTHDLLRRHFSAVGSGSLQDAFQEGWELGWESHKNEMLVATAKTDMAPHFNEDWEDSVTRSKL